VFVSRFEMTKRPVLDRRRYGVREEPFEDGSRLRNGVERRSPAKGREQRGGADY